MLLHGAFHWNKLKADHPMLKTALSPIPYASHSISNASVELGKANRGTKLKIFFYQIKIFLLLTSPKKLDPLFYTINERYVYGAKIFHKFPIKG